jgi:hypothetical protein
MYFLPHLGNSLKHNEALSILRSIRGGSEPFVGENVAYPIKNDTRKRLHEDSEPERVLALSREHVFAFELDSSTSSSLKQYPSFISSNFGFKTERLLKQCIMCALTHKGVYLNGNPSVSEGCEKKRHFKLQM